MASGVVASSVGCGASRGSVRWTYEQEEIQFSSRRILKIERREIVYRQVSENGTESCRHTCGHPGRPCEGTAEEAGQGDTWYLQVADET